MKPVVQWNIKPVQLIINVQRPGRGAFDELLLDEANTVLQAPLYFQEDLRSDLSVFAEVISHIAQTAVWKSKKIISCYRGRSQIA